MKILNNNVKKTVALLVTITVVAGLWTLSATVNTKKEAVGIPTSYPGAYGDEKNYYNR